MLTLRATRTRRPARSISISVRLVSSSSNASSRMRAPSSLALGVAVGLFSGWGAIFSIGIFEGIDGDASGGWLYIGFLGADFGGKAADGEPVSVDTEAAQSCEGCLGGEGMVAEIFAGMDIADMQFNGGDFHRFQGVVEGNPGERKAPRAAYDCV